MDARGGMVLCLPQPCRVYDFAAQATYTPDPAAFYAAEELAH